MRFRSAPGRRWHEPAALLRHLGITRPEAIDVEAIARYCNARVSYQPLRGCAGRLIGHRGRAVITVDRDAHAYRRRFTIAHELGHWMLDRADVAHTYTESGWDEPPDPVAINDGAADDWNPNARWQHEQRANRWAAELLMPEAWFAGDAAGREISFATVFDLARRYRTSLTATALRLIDLGSAPATLVRIHQRPRWFRNRQGLWWRPGSGVPEGLRLHAEPLPGAVAYDLLTDRPADPGPTVVNSELWIQRQDAWWYRLHEDSRVIGNGDVLTLLSWPDNAQLRGARTYPGSWLPWKPGKNARTRLIRCLCDRWHYRQQRRKSGDDTPVGSSILITDRPRPQRLVVPPARKLHAEDFRRWVDQVAKHQGVKVGAVLLSMLQRPRESSTLNSSSKSVAPSQSWLDSSPEQFAKGGSPLD